MSRGVDGEANGLITWLCPMLRAVPTGYRKAMTVMFESLLSVLAAVIPSIQQTDELRPVQFHDLILTLA